MEPTSDVKDRHPLPAFEGPFSPEQDIDEQSQEPVFTGHHSTKNITSSQTLHNKKRPNVNINKDFQVYKLYHSDSKPFESK